MNKYTSVIRLLLVGLLILITSCIMVAPTIQSERSDNSLLINPVIPQVKQPRGMNTIKLPPIASYACILENDTFLLTNNPCQ